MAQRRMFNKTVIDSDAFLDLPPTAQALYFHLGMRADDDGFVNNPRQIVRMAGAAPEDLQRLIDGGFLLSFDGGVLAIRHWRVHNSIRKDRHTPTPYQKALATMELDENGAYFLCGNQMATEKRIEQDSIVSLLPLPGACAPAQEGARCQKTEDAEKEEKPQAPPPADGVEALEQAELEAARRDAPDEESTPEERAAHEALLRHIRQKRRLKELCGAGILLSDWQYEALCEQLSPEELVHYTGVLADCLQRGHSPRSHYAFIMKMVGEDRRMPPAGSDTS